jgi:hypothetical protein
LFDLLRLWVLILRVGDERQREQRAGHDQSGKAQMIHPRVAPLRFSLRNVTRDRLYSLEAGVATGFSPSMVLRECSTG